METLMISEVALTVNVIVFFKPVSAFCLSSRKVS